MRPPVGQLSGRLLPFTHRHVIKSAGRSERMRMTDVQCVKCGKPGEPIADPLYLGRLEAEVKAKVCKACWRQWEGMRVMVINEYQVNLGEESGRELVKKQMRAFLNLGEQADTSKLQENYSRRCLGPASRR